MPSFDWKMFTCLGTDVDEISWQGIREFCLFTVQKQAGESPHYHFYRPFPNSGLYRCMLTVETPTMCGDWGHIPCVVIEDTYLLHVFNWEELPRGGHREENKKEILSLDFKWWQNEDVTNAQWKTGSSFFSPLTPPGLYFLPPHLRLKANSKNFSFQNHGQQLASGLGARGSQTRGKHPTKQILTEYILGPVLLDDTEIPLILTFKNSISSSHQHS